MTAHTIVATLNIAGDSAGMKKRCSALSIAIITAAVATIARNGNMMRVRRIVSSSFPGTSRNPSAYSSHERLGEQDARDDDRAGNQEKHGDDIRREPPRGGSVARRERARERRHERGAERAFGEQIAQDVGEAERDAEGVHRIAGAEEVREDLIADESQHAAGHRRDADDASRSDEL